jgi:predicted RNA-binding protein with PIN domain
LPGSLAEPPQGGKAARTAPRAGGPRPGVILRGMAFTVLIDGYNLIAELWGMGRGSPTLERQRADLLALLGDYRRVRPNPLHVVFDGWRAGEPTGGRERVAGVDVTFSPKGVTADEVIRDLVREGGAAYLVVSSDAQVRRWATAAGADVADAATFAARLRAAPAPAAEPGEGGPLDVAETGDEDAAWSGHTVKKGNPRRRSKRQRALDRKLGRL